MTWYRHSCSWYDWPGDITSAASDKNSVALTVCKFLQWIFAWIYCAMRIYLSFQRANYRDLRYLSRKKWYSIPIKFRKITLLSLRDQTSQDAIFIIIHSLVQSGYHFLLYFIWLFLHLLCNTYYLLGIKLWYFSGTNVSKATVNDANVRCPFQLISNGAGQVGVNTTMFFLFFFVTAAQYVILCYHGTCYEARWTIWGKYQWNFDQIRTQVSVCWYQHLKPSCFRQLGSHISSVLPYESLLSLSHENELLLPNANYCFDDIQHR